MGLVGIYSFPKSGNTWMRVILGYLMEANASYIPDLHSQPLSDAADYKGFRFFKHHGGYNFTRWNDEYIETTHVIHIRRNPLDVFVSYLNFISDNVTGTAPIKFSSVDDIVGTEIFDLYFKTFVTTGHLAAEFCDITKSYFNHNKFWMTQEEVPVTLLKYEDLLKDTTKALAPICDLLQIEPEELKVAVQRAAVDTKKDGKFFWQQQEKNYSKYLTQEQIEFFVKYRGEESRQFGYDF